MARLAQSWSCKLEVSQLSCSCPALCSRMITAAFGSSFAPALITHRLGCSGQVLGLLQQHQHVVLDENFDSGLVERTEEPDASQGDVHVWGSLVAFVERLDDELFKSLQVQCWFLEFPLYLSMGTVNTLITISCGACGKAHKLPHPVGGLTNLYQAEACSCPIYHSWPVSRACCAEQQSRIFSSFFEGC